MDRPDIPIPQQIEYAARSTPCRIWLIGAMALCCLFPYSTPAEPPGRIEDGLILLYDFMEQSGSTVHDVSGVPPEINLTVEDPAHVTWLDDGGLRIDQATIIETFSPATKLHAMAMASHEITVEAWILPANLVQDGPARIVALTDNPVDPSNFLVGQGRWDEQNPEVIDVRCPLNTHLPSTQTPPGSLQLELTHVVFTRDGPTNTNRIYLNGQLRATSERVGDFSDWDTANHLNVVNDQTRDRPWLGTLYLISIYDRDLSAAEIAVNYAAGPVAPPPLALPSLGEAMGMLSIVSMVLVGLIALGGRATAKGSSTRLAR
jgi:hypothetical protein